MSAREDVLGRIRAAIGPEPVVPEVARAYRTGLRGSGAPDDVQRFAAVAADYRATVTRTDAGGLPGVLAERCAAHGARRLAVAPGVVARPEGIELIGDDPPLPAADLDALDGVLSGCAVAIAETGTIVLDGGPASGRRVLTLVPDLHVCIVRADQVVRDVPEAIAALHPAAVEGRAITMISGPSATSDIELERVEGVHGPRRLEIVLVDDRQPASSGSTLSR